MVLGPEQLIDTGFVLFVVFTCGYSILSNRDRGQEKSRKWIEELSALQEALRELIGEASAASSNLDRTLVKRKQELETLIKKIDAAKASSEVPELPNDTWERRAQPERAPQESRQSQPRQEPRPRPTTPAPSAPQLPRRPIADPRDSELARRIEVILESKPAPKPASEDSLDPVAYKIAKRLLLSGKEIHLVARKVGLPVEEVRVLDTMLREAEGSEEPEFKMEPTPPPTAYSRAKKIQPVQDSWSDELSELLEAEESRIQTSGIRRATTLL